MKSLSKLFLALIALVTFCVLSALVLSFAIDDAQIKKTVQNYVNSHFKGRLTIDKARLNVLAGPSLQLTGVTYSPAGEPSQLTPKLAADSIDVRLQWRDIFDRKLHFILETQAAQFVFVQTTDLSSSAAPVTSPNSTAPATLPNAGTVAQAVTQNSEVIQSKAAASLLWFEDIQVTNANLIDTQIFVEKGGAKTRVGKFNIELSNLGLGKSVEYKLNGNVTYTSESTSATGDVLANGQFVFRDGVVEPATFRVDMTALSLQGKTFQKPAGIATEFKGSVSYAEKSLKLNSVTFTLPQVNTVLDGKILNTDTLDAEGVLRCDVEDLKALERLFVEPRTIEYGGQMNGTVSFKGRLSQMSTVQADIDLKQKISNLELNLKSHVADADFPRADFEVTSSKFDFKKQILPLVSQKNASQPYFKLAGENLVMSGTQDGPVTHVSELKAETFGGTFAADGETSSAGDRDLKFKMKMTGAEVQRVAELFSIATGQKMSGRADLSLNFSASTVNEEKLKTTLRADGKFKVSNAAFDATPLVQNFEKELTDSFTELPKGVFASKAFAEAEKILAEPSVRDLAKKNNFDLEKFRTRFESIRNLKMFSTRNPQDSKPLEGSFNVANGKTAFEAKRASHDGTLKVAGEVGFDSSLKGAGDFTVSPELRASLIEQSEYAKLVFVDGKTLQLAFHLAGTLQNPQVSLDVKRLEDTFQKNAALLTDEEISSETQRFANQVAKRLQGTKLGAEIEKALGKDPESGEPQKVEDLVKKAIEKNRDRLKKFLKKE